MYEYDWRETQLRAGGDAPGLMDARGLDYLQGMGYQAIYIAGTNFVNMPWGADGYSALDFTVLDPHYGTLQQWQELVDALHARGMYIILDFTVGTMGDMIGFDGHLNSSTPFSLEEYEVQWKLPPYAPWGFETYPDWNFTNTYNDSCVYPIFWQDDGTIVDPGKTGCYASNFDQYGDVEAFGVL
jgi:alpha-1,3-glucan synthase